MLLIFEFQLQTATSQERPYEGLQKSAHPVWYLADEADTRTSCSVISEANTTRITTVKSVITELLGGLHAMQLGKECRRVTATQEVERVSQAVPK